MAQPLVTGLNYCTTCLRLQVRYLFQEGERTRCQVALCPRHVCRVRIKSVVDPWLAAYQLAGPVAASVVLNDHPRVRAERIPEPERLRTYHVHYYLITRPRLPSR